MVVTDAPARMSRTDEVHRITENVYKSIMEQFNPCLRNFIAMGKSYEKALTSVTYAAKGYFDALVRMGEMASESQGSKDLGEVLFQMAEVHRQIQIQLEEMLKSFHNELLTELEKKVELDARYLNAALKKYQMEHKSKGESLEKCQAELKKLRRKSQGSKHPSKYGDKEMQYVEAISNKQSELDNYIAEGYKNALSEERRRYCFLVDRQCAVAKNGSVYHNKGKELLSQKIPVWQQACAEPNKLPDRAMFLAQQMSSVTGTMVPGGHHPGMSISEPIPGAKPLPVPPELAALRAGGVMGHQRLMEGGMPVMNGTGGAHGGEDYQQWMEGKVAQSKASPQTQRHGGEGYSNTLPVRKVAPAKSKTTLTETRTLPRSSSMAAGLEKNGRTRVQAIFSHAAGDNSTLLSFFEGDVVTLLVPEARDGWHYGENEKTRMRGWFPFSYTRVISDGDTNSMRQLRVHNLHGKSSSTGNLLEREDLALPVPDYGLHSRMEAQSAAALHGRQQQRPYSVAGPGFSQQGVEEYEPRFPTSIEPPFEPAVEAPAKPPLSEDEDEIEEDLSEKGHYDSLEKASPPPEGEPRAPSV
ncbi:brain-specific angiogenesis inhibitor 1-associated protein 2 isoform X2 [Etheostoma spectabile]|uniref:brain-specific angiogenesis inhibitor 1-associated protein 2 isoform X2 n=1 Tax=Etheostoma spectabile TaxID=54343 RepID=UPI0013AFAF77|nr:brain-specific angiogenesis inhibitor 1-associated protein 2-like isoform X2 [Etheostoma spectabile]